MEAQVYLYHTFQLWWTDFIGRRISSVLQYFNHSPESQLYSPLMYVEVWHNNYFFDCYKCDHLLHSEQGYTVSKLFQLQLCLIYFLEDGPGWVGRTLYILY